MNIRKNIYRIFTIWILLLIPGYLTAIRIDWPLLVPEKCTEEQLLNVLSVEINRLINQDFSRLIAILYRIDISELKLKKLLAENKGSDAGGSLHG